MMFKPYYKVLILALALTGLVSCGGGGGSTSFGSSDSNGGVSNSSGSSSSNTTNVDVTAGNSVATVSWTAPTQNTDDSALTDLSGFKIYYGTSTSSLSNSVTITNPSVTSYVFDNLTSGITVYFAVVAYNSTGIESYISNITSKAT